MPNTKNITQLGELKAKFAGAQALFLADYSGLNLKSQRDLRKKIRLAGGEMSVAKNTLLKITLRDAGVNVDAIAKELEGHNITLFALTDAVAPLKALVEFAKESDKPVLKAGILGKEVLSMAKVTQLANLPSKNELIAKLLGTLNNPARGLVSVLSATSRNLVYALSAVGKKKAISA